MRFPRKMCHTRARSGALPYPSRQPTAHLEKYDCFLHEPVLRQVSEIALLDQQKRLGVLTEHGSSKWAMWL